MVKVRFPPIDSILPPSWVERRWPVMLLALVAAGCVVGMVVWLVGGGPQAPSRHDTLRTSLPTKQFSYPSGVLYTTPQQRRVRFTTVSRPTDARVFSMLTKQDITTPPSPTSTARAEQFNADRAALASAGYDLTPEGFLNATRKGDLGLLVRYLRSGMAVDSTNAFGSTALFAAAENNRIEAAKLLIAAGADPRHSNSRGITPLHRAVEQNSIPMAELLLAVGADPELATVDGWTPVFMAVQAGNETMVEVLLASGANLNKTDRLGMTPLFLAVRQNNAALAGMLIRRGAAVDAVDITGRTPLHVAVDGGSYALAKLLLEAGANANAQTRNGARPLDIALEKQNLAIANLLLAHGATRPTVLGR